MYIHISIKVYAKKRKLLTHQCARIYTVWYSVYTQQVCSSGSGGAYRSIGPKVGRMYEHTLVRDDPNHVAFRLDEQPLGQHGGSVATIVRPKQKLARTQQHPSWSPIRGASRAHVVCRTSRGAAPHTWRNTWNKHRSTLANASG